MSGATATSWLIHTLGGGGLLLLAAWAWTAWTRQPARRLRVAEWAVTASLVLAVLSLAPAWLVLNCPATAITSVAPSPAVAKQATTQREEPAAPAPAPVQPPMIAPLTPLPDLLPSVQAPAPPEPELPPAAASAAPAHPVAPSSRWDEGQITALALMLYLACGAGILCRWLCGWIALKRLLWSSEPGSGRAARLFAEMAGPRNPTRLLISRQARTPFSCGLWRPTVVAPAGLCETASDEVLHWVFAHELAHVERRDAWSSLLFSLGQAVYFSVPWFWVLRRQARLCQEYLADAAAASAGGRPEDYAQFLLAWTTAPRAPVGACGVWGRSSELFWRIKTMLQNPVVLERRCPRRWSITAACGLLSLAVLAAGLTLKATAAPAPAPKDEPKKEAPKADEPAQPLVVPELPLPNIEGVLNNLPPNLDAEQVKQLRKQMEMARAQVKKMLEQQRRNGLGIGAPFGTPGAQPPQDGRLGVEVERPSDTLIEQLDLPKDQGLIIREVAPDSAAAKAGLKPHDILLEVNDKAVSSDPQEFRKALEAVKADTPVDAVVLRKGKKETIKGLSLPEAKASADGFSDLVPPLAPPANFPNINVPNPVVPPLILNPVNPNGGVITTTFRTNDHFTTRHQEGSLIITLTGKTADGKATVNEISVQDGAESNKYESLDKVPDKYRDKVKNLVEMSEKGSVQVEIKAP